MAAILAGLATTLGKSLVSMILAGATQSFFQEVAMLVLEKGAKSTKTDWDDKVVESFKKSIDKSKT